MVGEQVWCCHVSVALLTLVTWRASRGVGHSIMSDTMVPFTARSTLAIDWDSETRSLYFDEQESEVCHLGFVVSAVFWFLLWKYIDIPLIDWTTVKQIFLMT